MANKSINKHSTSLVINKMQIKAKIPPQYSLKWQKLERWTEPSADMVLKRKELSYIASSISINLQSMLENCLPFPTKDKQMLIVYAAAKSLQLCPTL